MHRKRILYLILIFYCSTLSASKDNLIIECNEILIQAIMEDNFSPPVASRIHLYANIAAYESLCLYDSKLQSLAEQITHLPKLSPSNISRSDRDMTAAFAFLSTAKKYLYTEDKIDSLIHKIKTTHDDTSKVNASYRLATHISDWIIQWSYQDDYGHTRTLRRYELSDSLGAWKPTPPEYHNGLEPNWKMIRKLVFDSLEFVSTKPNYPYSEDPSSPCYQNALDVYRTSLHLSEEQIQIARYWDDNPMTTIARGHLMMVVKKPTPAGHWFRIATQIIRSHNYTLTQSSEVYTLLSIGIFESFIHCWNTKYQTNAIRPETYIQRIIEPNWSPLIETPPFPEYTSGHSVVSGCASDILAHFFGNQYAFTDSSQIPLDLGTRHFKSFYDAAEEASISRLYAGIHYRPSLINGLAQGRTIAREVLSRLKTRRKDERK